MVWALAACGGLPEEPLPEPYPITGPDVAFSCADPWCPTVEWAVDRWNRATGWQATVSPGGIPVIFTNEPAESAGLCGVTMALAYPGESELVAVDLVEIPLYERPGVCWDLHRTLTHELAHTLHGVRGEEGHDDDACVMATYATGGDCFRITDETLDLVCNRWGCPGRRPEGGLGSVRYPPPPVD